MPIFGLTDQPPTFTEIGRLRKGEKKTEDNKPGKDLTYFRPDFHEGEDKAAAMFLEAYGTEPREVNILLPFDSVGENLDAWRKAYLAGGLLHKCDGRFVNYAVDPETGEELVRDGKDADGNPVRCDGKPVTHWTDKQGQEHPVYCEPVAHLYVLVPELRRLAYVTVVTTSTWDVLNLSRQLEGIKAMNRGSLRGIPLVLKRRPYVKSTPGANGKRRRRKMWLLSVEADPDWVEVQLAAMKRATLPNGDAILELPPGIPDTNGDDEEVVYEVKEQGRVWEDEKPEYEAEEPPVFTNMNDFYAKAQGRFGYPDKEAVVAVLAKVLGQTVLAAQRQGTTMQDLWGILLDEEDAGRQELADAQVDYEGVPF